jgi:hypothetical protein
MLQLHFAEFLKTGALVLPIQIERHWRDIAARSWLIGAVRSFNKKSVESRGTRRGLTLNLA